MRVEKASKLAMNRPEVTAARLIPSDAVALAARWAVGGVFLYAGLSKALHAVEFLKLVRAYDVVQSSLLLNLIAAGLPWLEVFCGMLLLAGVAVRGSALVLVTVLVPFTGLVLERALEIHGAGALSFCAIKFDCGCGTGEVRICQKLAENAALIFLSAVLVQRGRHPVRPRPAGTGVAA